MPALSLAPDLATYSFLPLFDGFPYLTPLVGRGLSHITLLPTGMSEAALLDLTRLQVLANRLPTYLVLSQHDARCFDAGTATHVRCQPPAGGRLVSGFLERGFHSDTETDEYRLRRLRLRTLINWLPKGHVAGDPRKGGRRATAEEAHSLLGFQPDGTPTGLRRCTDCGEWAGTCLDPSADLIGLAMTVHCPCENHNRCARCKGPLAHRRLNANYYNPLDGQIHHVPGYVGFDHECGTAEWTLSHPPALVGAWSVRYCDADHGPETVAYRERLELHADGTFAWSPHPDWVADAGIWGARAAPGGGTLLCLQEARGRLLCHYLWYAGNKGLGSSTLSWRRTNRLEVTPDDVFFRAVRAPQSSGAIERVA